MEFLKRAARQIPAVLGLVLLVGAIYVIWKEFRHLKVADIKVALEAIPPRALVIVLSPLLSDEVSAAVAELARGGRSAVGRFCQRRTHASAAQLAHVHLHIP